MVASVPLDTAGARHLFRRRAFPLRADRRRGVSAVRRVLLLVPEDHRPDAERDAPGRWHFWLVLRRLQRRPSSRCTSSGSQGMPRRVYTYPAGDGLGRAEPVRQRSARCCSPPASCCSSSMSSAACAAGASPATIPGTPARSNGRRPRRRPPTTSPHSRRDRAASRCGTSGERCRSSTGLRVDRRELLDHASSPSAEPRGARVLARARRSGRSGRASRPRVMFIGSIFTPWAVVWGAIPLAITLTGWFWPKGRAGAPSRRAAARASSRRRAGMNPLVLDSPTCRPRLRPAQHPVVGHARLHADRGHRLRAGDRPPIST